MPVNMKCLVLVLVVACVGAEAAATCARSQEFFLRHNVSADESSEPGANDKQHDSEITIVEELLTLLTQNINILKVGKYFQSLK